MESLKDNITVNKIGKLMSKSKVWYIICFFCVCTGVVVGIYSIRYMTEESSKGVVDLIKQNLMYIQGGEVFYKDIVYRSLKLYIPTIVIVWILGFTIIGIPVVLLINSIKGFTFGFTLGFLILFFGDKNINFSIIMFLIQNLIIIPIFIISSVISINMTSKIFFDKNKEKRNKNMLNYSIGFIGIISLIVLISIVQSITSPIIIESLIKML